MANPTFRRKISASALALAGILFILYPALRPFSDESSMAGAAAFASTEWLAAHIMAMVAFTFLVIGFIGIDWALSGTQQVGSTYWGEVLAIVGIGLTLPFYGGEAYGLNAIGAAAVSQGSAELLSIAEAVRSGPGLILFLLGLLLLAISGIVVATALWKAPSYSKWTGIPLAAGLLLYIPQFFWTQPLRVAHGVLVAIGCLWIARELWKNATEA